MGRNKDWWMQNLALMISRGPRGVAARKSPIFVDAKNGADTNDGETWETPYKTMSKAFAVVESGGCIVFSGKVLEQLVTPVNVFDVDVIGAGTRPHHADATPAGGDLASGSWGAPAAPVAATPLVRVIQQGWRFSNILFAPPSDAAGIEIVRNAGAGDLERDGSHASVIGCRFAAGQDGICFGKAATYTEIVYNVLIEGNVFADQTGSAIKTAIEANAAVITRNRFRANANHIVAALRNSQIDENILGAFTTMGIDLNGGSGSNIITKNYLSGTYSVVGGYRKANANDEWAGNFNTLTGGITAADPA